MDVVVYAWGYGDVLREVLNGISMLVAQAEYVTWLKIAFLLSSVVLITMWIRGRAIGDSMGIDAGIRNPFYPITYFLATYLIFMAFVMGPQARVNIYDEVTNDYYSVSNVPIGIAVPLSLFSNFERSIGYMAETFFGVPDEISYTKSGFLSGIVAVKVATDARIVDPRLMTNINNFSVDCVIPGILAGEISRNELLNGDFLEELNNVNPARTTIYRRSDGTDEILNCLDAKNRIELDLVAAVGPSGVVIDYIGGITGLKDQFLAVLQSSLDYLLNYAGTAEDYLKYNIFMNQFLVAEVSWLQANGVSASQAAVGTALAERHFASQTAISGILAKGYIPVIKGIMTIVLVASIPVVVISLMLGGVLFSRRVIFTGLITVLLWLSLWHFTEVILNMIVMVKTGTLLQDLVNDVTGLNHQLVVSQNVTRYANMVAQYYWSIPFFTLLIAGGFSMYTMNHLAGVAAGTVTGASSFGASQAATGSLKASEISMGNVRVRTFTEDVFSSGIWNENVEKRNYYARNYTMHGDPFTGTLVRGTEVSDGGFQGNINGKGFTGSGYWERNEDGSWRLISGEAVAYTTDALRKITGGEYGNLINARVVARNGQIVSVSGIDPSTGGEVMYKRGDEGRETMTYRLGGWEVKAIKGEDGEWKIVSAKSPAELRTAQAYIKNLEENIARMDAVARALRAQEGLANTDTQTFMAGYRLAYDIAHGKGQASEYVRDFAKTLLRETEEAALTKLAQEGRLSLSGRQLTEKEVANLLRMGGGLELFGVKWIFRGSLGGGIEKVYATRDGYIVQDDKGRYWFFGKDERIQEALRDAWRINLSGQNRDLFERMERAGRSDYSAEDFRKDLQEFRSSLGEYAKQRKEELQQKLSYAKRNEHTLSANLAHLLVSHTVDETGGDLGEALTRLNEMLSSPEGIKKLMNLGDEVIKRLMNEEDRRSWDGLKKPDVRREEVARAGEEAHKKGMEAYVLARNLKEPEDAMKKFEDKKTFVEGKMGEFENLRIINENAIDLQRNFYEKHIKNDEGLNELRKAMQEFREDLNRLVNMNARKEELEQRLSELKERMGEIKEKAEERKRWLDYNISLAAAAMGLSKEDIWELILDDEKFRAYREFVESLPVWERAGYLDPNIIEGFRREWNEILRIEGQTNLIGAAINQYGNNIEKLKEEIKEVLERIKENETGRMLTQAQEMAEGEYTVRRDKVLNNPRITTRSEETINRITQGDRKIHVNLPEYRGGI